MYTENYRILLKEVVNKWKDILCSLLTEDNIVKMAAAAKLLSRFSRVRLLETPWTAASQAPPSLGFSRQEHWSGLLFPSAILTWQQYPKWSTDSMQH